MVSEMMLPLLPAEDGWIIPEIEAGAGLFGSSLDVAFLSGFSTCREDLGKMNCLDPGYYMRCRHETLVRPCCALATGSLQVGEGSY